MFQIDRCAYTNRWCCRHPLEKLTLALGMLLLSLLLPPVPGALLIFGVMALVTVAGAGIPLALYLRLLLAPAGFALTGAATMLVTFTPGAGWHLSLTSPGGAAAGRLLLRSLAAVTCLYFLALTTPMVDLVSTLRRVRVPELLIELMLLIYRFLFLLADTAAAMQVAQAARLGYATLRQTRRSVALLAAALLGQVLDRARRLEVGLGARGYDGRLLVLPEERSLSPLALGGVIGLQLLVAALSLYVGRAGHV